MDQDLELLSITLARFLLPLLNLGAFMMERRKNKDKHIETKELKEIYKKIKESFEKDLEFPIFASTIRELEEKYGKG